MSAFHPGPQLGVLFTIRAAVSIFVVLKWSALGYVPKERDAKQRVIFIVCVRKFNVCIARACKLLISLRGFSLAFHYEKVGGLAWLLTIVPATRQLSFSEKNAGVEALLMMVSCFRSLPR